MKKEQLLTMMLLFVTLSACHRQINEFDVAGQEITSSNQNESFYRDYESALKIAKSQVFGFETDKTRSIKDVTVKNHYMYTPICTRSAANQESPSFHVINFEDEKGFAVISADERATPVYAYSDKGNLNLNEAVQESGWGYFMDLAVDNYIAEINSFPRTSDTLLKKPNEKLPLINQEDSVKKYIAVR